MEFCPKCGGMLVPQKEGRSRVLTCQHCGRKVRPKRKTTYKISEKVNKVKEVAVVVEKKKKKKKVVEKEYELEPIEYEEDLFEG